MTGTANNGENGNGLLGSYHWNRDDQSPSLAIVVALADLQDAAPATLDALYNNIDPDALDRLLDNDRAEQVVVEFQKGDHRITINDDGDIQIRDAEDSEKR